MYQSQRGSTNATSRASALARHLSLITHRGTALLCHSVSLRHIHNGQHALSRDVSAEVFERDFQSRSDA